MPSRAHLMRATEAHPLPPNEPSQPLPSPLPLQPISNYDLLEDAGVTHWQSFVYWTGIRSFLPHPHNGEGNTPAEKHLRQFHVELIALGGAIGTGFLIASGQAIATAGPISTLLAFGYVGLTAFLSVHSLGELCASMPVYGSFVVFSSRFLDQAWGAALGWNYTLLWLAVLPVELIAASNTIQYWPGSMQVPPYAFICIFMALIMGIHLFGVRGFGNCEAALTLVKVIAIVGFLIFGVCRDISLGWPGETPIGVTNWYNPGSFNNGWKGLFSVMVVAAFANGGVELAGVSAANMTNPRQALPKAIRGVFWRIVLFYMGGILVVGLLVKYTDPDLLGTDSSTLENTQTSPFIIAIKQAHIQALPSIFNAVICVAVVSVGNSSVFTSTRMLTSMADNGIAPEWLCYYDTKSRPMAANGVAFACGLLAFFAQASFQKEVFKWLLALSGLSGIITWSSICASHISFRWAYEAQRRTSASDRLQPISQDRAFPFLSPYGTIGSWIGLLLNSSIIAMQIVVAIFPVGYKHMSPSERARNFFQSTMAFVIFLLTYLGYKVKFQAGWKPAFRTSWKNPFLKKHPMECENPNCQSLLPSHSHPNDTASNATPRGLEDPGSSSITQKCHFIYLDELLWQYATSADEEESSLDGSDNEDYYQMSSWEIWIANRYKRVRGIFAFPWK